MARLKKCGGSKDNIENIIINNKKKAEINRKYIRIRRLQSSDTQRPHYACFNSQHGISVFEPDFE